MDYWWDLLNMVLIFSIFTISLNLLVGYAGQVSVAHAAFGAVGGYIAAYLTSTTTCGFWLALLAGTAGAGVAGVLMSLPALRLAPEYLVLLTIAVSSIVLAALGASPQLGGAYGIVADRAADLWPLPGGELVYPSQWVLPLIGFTAFTYVVCHRMGESAWGRVLRGIRDDEVAVRALGDNVFAVKVVVFGITSAFAGIAGVLLFFYNQIASPNVYGLSVSLKIFAMTIFGGLGNFTGSVVGAAALQLLQPLLEKIVRIDPSHAFLVQLVIYGLGLVLLMRVRSQGLLPEGFRLWRWSSRPPEAAEVHGSLLIVGKVHGASPNLPSPRRLPVTGDVVLAVHDLSKSFGGIHAVRGLDFQLPRGKISALIGPNGAGKTTVFNLLTGSQRPDTGRVLLNGKDVHGMPPNRVARLGMVRSFQDVRLFGRMTTLDKVMVGIREPSLQARHWPSGYRGATNLFDLFLQPKVVARVERETRERAMALLDQVGLAEMAGAPAASLSYGQQKLISFARLLGTNADVLLLDEPSSGVDSRWVDRILELISLMRDSGKTVCIVEHSLHVVERLADTVIFMELGRISAQGTVRELTSDPRLAEVYFGTV